MNIFNDLRDEFAKNPPQIYVPDVFTKELFAQSKIFFNENNQNAVCFDAGDVDRIYGLKVINDLIVLPYETTWIQFDINANGVKRIGFLVKQLDGGRYIAHEFMQLDVGAFTLATIIHRNGDGSFDIPSEIQNDSQLFAGVESRIRLIPCFLSALNCTNVHQVEHKADERLQKARVKRGKKPLFSFWTLELDLSRPESRESLGGTHASPRLHLRRGHPRQYAPGKYTWVQPCVVGNKALGMIHKDYSLAA